MTHPTIEADKPLPADTATGTDAADTARRLLDAVGGLIREINPRQSPRAVSLDAAFERDLGLDSLGRVELMARVEKTFGAALPDSVFANAESPRDLLRALLATGRAGAGPAIAEFVAAAGGEGHAAPVTTTTLADVLDWHAAAHPERTHIRFFADGGDDDILTYGELRAGAGRAAAALQAHGLAPGQAVVIMLPTGRDYFTAFFGTLLAGGIPVPIYPPARPAHIEEHLRRHARIVANSRGALMVTVPEARTVAKLLRAQAESLSDVLTPADLAGARGTAALPALAAGDIAFLQYTSGSTGDPKGVVLTHANLLANIRAMGTVLDVGPADVFVSWLPLYHDMGLIGAWLGSLYYGIPLVLMSPLQFLARPERWLTAIHRYRGTLSAAPNFAYELCLRRLGDDVVAGLDLSSWRMAANGAEAVSPDTVERFCERFAACGFRRQALMPMYGLAENSVGLAFSPLDRGPLVDHVKRAALMERGRAEPAPEDDGGALRFVACGRPLPAHQIRVVDVAGRELPERHEGRLQFKGPSSTSGYYRNADATRALFDGDWLESGDLGYVAGGDVYITGRKKDVVIKAGRNIYPPELEEAIGGLAGIRRGNVAVFGSPDAANGTERLIVLAETRARDGEARAELEVQIRALAESLIGMPPDDVVLAPPNTVLKTSSGKIRRASCRAFYERGLVDAPRRALWWQLVRLGAASLVPRARRAFARAGAVVYAARAWLVLLLVSPPGWLAVVLAPNERWRWAAMRGALWAMSIATGTRIEVKGASNLPPPGRGCIYVSNHASNLDGAAMSMVLPGPFSFVAKAELKSNLIAGTLLARIGAEFVERFDKNQRLDDARRLAALARAGRAVFYFAEGTFTRMPGLLPFRMGAFAAAVKAEVPVIPLAIRGTRSMLPDESNFLRRGAITVTIGSPIDTAAVRAATGAEGWSLAVRLRDEARRRILNSTGEPDLDYERPFAAPEFQSRS